MYTGKYPKIPNLRKAIEALGEGTEFEAYIMPKFDGSNIKVMGTQFLTRNLFVAARWDQEKLCIKYFNNLGEMIAKIKPELIEQIIETSRGKNIVIFMELGGWNYCPANYCRPWLYEVDFRIFDMIYNDKTLPLEVMYDIAMLEWDDELLHHLIPYEKVKVEMTKKFWRQVLNEYSIFEGVVVKTYETEIKNWMNAYIFKVKHDGIASPTWDHTEILSEVQRVLDELGAIDWNEVKRRLDEEAEARGLPKLSKRQIKKIWRANRHEIKKV